MDYILTWALVTVFIFIFWTFLSKISWNVVPTISEAFDRLNAKKIKKLEYDGVFLINNEEPNLCVGNDDIKIGYWRLENTKDELEEIICVIFSEKPFYIIGFFKDKKVENFIVYNSKGGEKFNLNLREDNISYLRKILYKVTTVNL